MGARVLYAVGLVWCVLVVAVHWGAASLACAFDTSNCAYGHDKNGVYEGLLRNGDRALTNRSFTVAFASRSDKPTAGPFRTSRNGDYCVVWANERITPFARARGGGDVALRDWHETSDPPAGCQSADEGIPWNRADDRMSRPQFIVPIVLGAIAAVLLLVGLVGGATRRRAGRAGLVLALVTTAAVAAVWLV